ncbi:MAG: hypothetical protein ACRESZ_17385 [Methylococcales bacterium]
MITHRAYRITRALPKAGLPGVKFRARIAGANTSVVVWISVLLPDAFSSKVVVTSFCLKVWPLITKILSPSFERTSPAMSFSPAETPDPGA